MQLIKLQLDHDNLFCPVSGKQVTSTEHYEASPALVGMWVDGAIEDPEIHCDRLEAAWDAHREKDDDGYVEVAEFLRSFDRDDYVCFEITTEGMSCGPMTSTAWFVFNMNYQEFDFGD